MGEMRDGKPHNAHSVAYCDLGGNSHLDRSQLHNDGGVSSKESQTSTLPYKISEVPLGTLRRLKIVTIGAGASGINMAFQIKSHMQNVEHVVYEKNADVGGTWFENRYPGCACDIPSHNYQFTWNLNPSWSSFFAPQAEILRYLEQCCDKFDLRRFIKTRHLVRGAHWEAKHGMWTVAIFDEEKQVEFQDSCHFLIDGSGILNNWKWPDIEGLHTFQGNLVHSANWPKNLDVKDKIVAILGSGSSGVQLVPTLQPNVRKLVHFIRSSTWVVPPRTEQFSQITNIDIPQGQFDERQIQEFVENPALYMNFVKTVEHEINLKFRMLINGSKEQALARLYAKAYMESVLGENTSLKERLIPDFPIGCRRITPGVGYLEALSAENVQVITDRCSEIIPEGIVLGDGTKIPIDILICATGFDVSFVPRFPIIGKKGNLQGIFVNELSRSYLSIAIANCPNYFVILGPNAPIGHGSALTIIEHASKYVIKMMLKAQSESIKSFVPSETAIREYGEHIDNFMPRTAWSATCRSWFKDGRSTGPVTALHPGSRIHWFHMLEQPRFEDYEWEYVTGNRFQYLGNGFSTKEAEGMNDTWYLDKPSDLTSAI